MSTDMLWVPCPACQGGGEWLVEYEVVSAEERTWGYPGAPAWINALGIVEHRDCTCLMGLAVLEGKVEESLADMEPGR